MAGRRTTCPWCHGNDTDYDERDLCRPHLAEFEGLTLSELDRMLDEQADELADTFT